MGIYVGIFITVIEWILALIPSFLVVTSKLPQASKGNSAAAITYILTYCGFVLYWFMYTLNKYKEYLADNADM